MWIIYSLGMIRGWYCYEPIFMFGLQFIKSVLEIDYKFRSVLQWKKIVLHFSVDPKITIF